jgi:hypothetical protein
MTDFPLFSGRFRERLGEPTTAESPALGTAFGRLRNREDVVIDIGGSVLDPVINRGGLPVKPPPIDQDRLNDLIAIRPIVSFRVIGQSVAPGTPVPQGTVVNLVMARAGGLPIGVGAGVHLDLRDESVETQFERLGVGSATVRRLLTRAAKNELSDADREEVRGIFVGNNIPITAEPGRDVDAALETLKMLSTFGGQ